MLDIARVGLKDFTRSAKILILTNLIYAFVMPVIDIFVPLILCGIQTIYRR